MLQLWESHLDEFTNAAFSCDVIDNPLAEDIKHATIERLAALEEIGLGYLTLDRAIGTLSGGEAQRCKIAKYINSPLSDVMYILDEPSVGLHNHDILLMQKSVQKLKNHGNTVILVEHHKEMIKIADHIIDMGPSAGMKGGEIVTSQPNPYRHFFECNQFHKGTCSPTQVVFPS